MSAASSSQGYRPSSAGGSAPLLELKVRAIRAVYDGEWVKVVLCFRLGDEEECREMVYRVLGRERFEEALAELIGELNAEPVLSYEGEEGEDIH